MSNPHAPRLVPRPAQYEIGNDVDEDLCSAKLGFDTYLITDTIVNRQNKDYSDYKNGSFEEFYKDFLKGD